MNIVWGNIPPWYRLTEDRAQKIPRRELLIMAAVRKNHDHTMRGLTVSMMPTVELINWVIGMPFKEGYAKSTALYLHFFNEVCKIVPSQEDTFLRPQCSITTEHLQGMQEWAKGLVGKPINVTIDHQRVGNVESTKVYMGARQGGKSEVLREYQHQAIGRALNSTFGKLGRLGRFEGEWFIMDEAHIEHKKEKEMNFVQQVKRVLDQQGDHKFVTVTLKPTGELRTYKTNLDLQLGDHVVVRAKGGGLYTAEVTKLNAEHPEHVNFKWVVQKVDFTAYDKRLTDEDKFIQATAVTLELKARAKRADEMIQDLGLTDEEREGFQTTLKNLGAL